MNPYAAQPTSLTVLLALSLCCNRQLIGQMTRCEVVGRYIGSTMGLACSFFNLVPCLSRLACCWPKLFFDFHLHKQPLPERDIKLKPFQVLA